LSCWRPKIKSYYSNRVGRERSQPASHDDRPSLIGVFVRSSVAAAAVTTLYAAGYLGGLQRSWTDAWGRAFQPRPSSHVALVAISEDDYQAPGLFGGTSPLNPATLQRLFERLAQHRPAVVVVDILLQPSPHEPADRDKQRRELYATLSKVVVGAPTRWVLAAPSGEVETDDARVLAAWKELQVVGGDQPDRLTFAVAQLDAEGGVVRRIARCVDSGPAGMQMATLFGAALAEGRSACANAAHRVAERIRYTGSYSNSGGATGLGHRFTVSELLDPPSPPQGATILTGKTVVVGGTYHSSGDTHWTPIGTLYGAEVWAEGLDTAFRQDALDEIGWPVMLVLQTLVGFATGWLALRFQKTVGQVIAVVAFVAVTALCTTLSFGLGFVMISALPAFFATQVNSSIDALPNLLGELAQKRIEKRRRRPIPRRRKQTK